MESNETIANHIMALFCAKIQSYTKSKESLDIDFERENEDGAVYMYTSQPGVSNPNGPQYEKR